MNIYHIHVIGLLDKELDIKLRSLNKQRCELTRIIYCTADVLLQRLILAKTLQDFTHIILDEVYLN